VRRLSAARLSPRRLAANWRLKLAALALAVLLWAVVSAEQEDAQWIPVRVEPQLRDPDYVLTGPPDPAQVEVRVAGPGRELWEVAIARPRIVLPVADVGDRRTFVLDPQNVRLPDGLRVRVQDVRPALVRLELQRLASRTVPVRLRIGERSLRRYVIGDSIRVGPDSVTVTGPADAVARLDGVPTRPFEVVPDDDSTFTGTVRLDTAELGPLLYSTRSVRVRGRMDRRGERVVAGVAVSVPPGLAVTPPRVDVHLAAGVRALDGVAPQGVRVAADSLPVEVPPGGIDVPVRVTGLPRGVSARTVPLRVRVAPAAVAPPAPPLDTTPPR
jgi:hypothetical protein